MPTFYEDEAISFVAGVANTGELWVSVASRRIDQGTTSRGRQFELDTVQTGEYHPTYDNRDGALTPGSSSSPYYPNVVPYRPVRKRFQFPATQNMLTPNQASSGEAVAVTTIDAPVAPGSTVPHTFGFLSNPTVQASGTAFEGAQVLRTPTIPGATTAGTTLVWFTGTSALPGSPHTFSVYVRTPTGSSACTAQASISWFDTNSALISSATGSALSLPVASATWTRITASGTPPANTAGMSLNISMTNSPATAFTLECDGAQLEYAAAATAYTKPSTWYPIFTGFIERWPVRWEFGGLFNKVSPVAVDHFGYLSQKILKPPFYADMLALNPRFLYTFDVGQTAGYVNDLSHNRGPAPKVNSWYGAGGLTFGNNITSIKAPTFDNPVGGNFLGGASTVASFNNTTSSVTNPQLPGSYIDLTAASNYSPPTGDGTGWYTRIIAFNASQSVPSWYMSLWSFTNPAWSFAFNGDVSFLIDNTETLSISGIANFGSNWAPGFWAFAAVRVNTSTGAIATYLNGFDGGTGSTSASNVQPKPGNSDAVGMQITPGVQNAGRGYVGDIAFVAEFPGYMAKATLDNLYTSFFTAFLFDTSAARYNRILSWAGYKGASNITTTPATVSMGPATDVTAGGQQASTYSPVTGTDAQTALQNVVTTEAGNHFVAADGTLTFQSRSSRYGVITPAITFGENPAGGEIPYEDANFDFDMTRIGNDVQVTQYMNSAVFEAFTPASQAQYGTRTLTRTINSSDTLECNDAASALAYKYANPDLRLKTLRVHFTTNPSAWATLLSLELGMRVRVKRRDLAATIQWDGFVEKISWSFDYAANDIFLELELSPADLSAFWELAAMHTTLSTSYSPAPMNSNTGFESGLSPWTSAGTTSFTQSSTQKHSGSFAARLVPDGVTANVGALSEQIAVIANGAVTVSAWAWFTNTVTGQYSLSVNWYNSSHVIISTSSVFVSVPATTWTQATNTFQAPAGAAYAAIVPVLIGTPAAGQIWYVDDATMASATIVLNPLPSASTLPVGAHIAGNATGTSNTVQVGSYTTGGGTYPAPSLRLGAGTGTFEEIAITSYTSTGGTQVQNYAGHNVPGQFTGYSTVTVTLATAPANSYTSGTAVSEALPAGMTDPTAHDADSNLGTTTIIGY